MKFLRGLSIGLVFILLLISVRNISGKRRSFHKRKLNEEFDLDLAERRAQKMINLIFQRFEMWHPTRRLFFLYIMNIPDWGWDIMKYKLALKTLLAEGSRAKTIEEGGEGANTNSVPSTSPRSVSSNLNKEFLMIFGGSSVTAGHDNRFNESWPLVFRRRVDGLFDALKVPLVVRNIAQGANNCFPSTFCYGAMGGDAPDWVNWEQSYNCGKAHNVFEHIAREAGWSDAVLHFAASGAFKPDDCKDMPIDTNITGIATKLPWAHESWTPENAGLKTGELIWHDYATEPEYLPHVYTPYYPNATKVAQLKQVLHEGYMEANPVGRFTGMMWPHYNGVAPHGFSVWTTGSEGDAMALKGPCYDKGGAHWMSHEAAVYSRGHGANWHPSAGMHLMRGEVLAYNYLHIFLDAVQMLRADLAGGETKAALIDKYKEKLKALQTPMPVSPLRCQPDCDVKPQCFTNFEPHYNARNRLSDLVVGSHEGWVYTEKSGSTNHIMDGIDWGYLDRRPCYESKGHPQAAISFKIEITSAAHNYVKLCAYDHKEGLKPASFYLDAFVDPPCSECEEAFDPKEGWGQGTPGDKSDTKAQADFAPLLHTDADAELVMRRLGEAEVLTGNNHSLLYSSSTNNPKVNSTQYVRPPISELMPLPARGYHGDECHLVGDLPVGRHVITVVTHKEEAHEAHKGHGYSVSHLLQW